MNERITTQDIYDTEHVHAQDGIAQADVHNHDGAAHRHAHAHVEEAYTQEQTNNKEKHCSVRTGDKLSQAHAHTHDGMAHGHVHTHDGEDHAHFHPNAKAVSNRLARAIGHLESVKRMVDRGEDCAQVLIQLAAVRSAINNAGKVLLADHINHCMVDAVENRDYEMIAELNEAIQKFIK